jgi:hypothetical protein
MRLRYAIPVFLFFISSWAYAYELIMIQAVSESKKTFITRNGRRQGIITGSTATFTAEDFSLLAKAINVTGNFTQWQVINAEAQIPFEKGALVTFYPAEEYLWALSPEKERRKYIKSMVRQPRKSVLLKGALTRTVSESTSEAIATSTKRGGFLGEIYYEQDFFYGFAFDIGVRYEREVIAASGISLITRRSLLIADFIKYFDDFEDTINGRLYIGAGAGYGISNTSTTGLSQSGNVSILPVVKAGASFPFNEEWEFLFDTAFESLQTKEEQEGGKIQTTTQTNLKASIALRKFF